MMWQGGGKGGGGGGGYRHREKETRSNMENRKYLTSDTTPLPPLG